MFRYWRSGSGTRRTSPGAGRSLCSPTLASSPSSTADVTSKTCGRLKVYLCANQEQGNTAVPRSIQHNTTFTTKAYHRSYLNCRVYKNISDHNILYLFVPCKLNLLILQIYIIYISVVMHNISDVNTVCVCFT